MPIEPTVDPTCWITGRGRLPDGTAWVDYATRAERWRIYGTCICCGACEVGSVGRPLLWTGIPIGEPGACLDIAFEQRPDVPVRPEIAQFPSCSLWGEYR
jgi:hypothetical protein